MESALFFLKVKIGRILWNSFKYGEMHSTELKTFWIMDTEILQACILIKILFNTAWNVHIKLMLNIAYLISKNN